MSTVTLPQRIGGETPIDLNLDAGTSVLFFGPNGAGKTRFAGYLDKTLAEKAILISAHRNVLMPKTYAVSDPDKEFDHIFGKASFGNSNPTPGAAKAHRYRNIADSFSSSDFQEVLNVLAARHIDGLNQFKKTYDPKNPPKAPINTLFETAIEIWAKCLPDLKIDISEAPKILIRRHNNPQSSYEPLEMSDGERGLFYLVAKSLIAPSKSVILVDEPEMYLHRAIRNTTWDLIEKSRPDCAFAYFTHDIDFSTTRMFSQKVGIYAHETLPNSDKTTGKWEYRLFEPMDQIDEDLLITVLGSRTNTLLVEGKKDSWDSVISRVLYPNILIEPMDGCEQVIRSVKALNSYTKFHTTKAYGLIDCDFRNASEITKLRSSGIHTHGFREIENVLASQEVIIAIMTNLNQTAQAPQVIASIVSEITSRIQADIQHFENKLSERIALSKFRTALYNGVNLIDCAIFLEPGKIQNNSNAVINQLLTSKNLNELLKLFSIRKDNYKQQLAQKFGLKSWSAVEDKIMSWIKDDTSQEHQRLVAAIKGHFPII